MTETTSNLTQTDGTDEWMSSPCSTGRIGKNKNAVVESSSDDAESSQAIIAQDLLEEEGADISSHDSEQRVSSSTSSSGQHDESTSAYSSECLTPGQPQDQHPITTPTKNIDHHHEQEIIINDDAAHLALISSRVRHKHSHQRRKDWTPSSWERRQRWSRQDMHSSTVALRGAGLPVSTVQVPPTSLLLLSGGEEDFSHASSLTGSQPQQNHVAVVVQSRTAIAIDDDDEEEDMRDKDIEAQQHQETNHVDNDRNVQTDAAEGCLQSGDENEETCPRLVAEQGDAYLPTSDTPHHIYTYSASEDSKYASYSCTVDASQRDRSVEIHIASFRRPHMRAFHMAWIAFFVAFFTWFALTPLLSEVQRSLDLTHEEIWTSSTFAVAGSAVTRILIGPVNDICGARWSMTGTLVLSAIPTGLVGLVNTAMGLNVIRLFIGVAGSAFVTCQYWTQAMFTQEIAGTANALVAGWYVCGQSRRRCDSNLMGSLLFPLFKTIYGGSGWTRSSSPNEEDTNESFDRAADLSWRTICVFPALLCLVTAYIVMRVADDSPKGNYRKLSRQGLMPSISARSVLKTGLKDRNTWVLFVQYGFCFGVEITMINAAALYFKEEFGLTTESAAAIASIFGWMNLFARGVGGFLSDMANAKYGMRGRLWVHVIMLSMEGVMVIVFAQTETLGGAIIVMIVFSVFVQAAEGTTFSIVPYVNPEGTGSISGIVGAGGNVGGVGLSILFRESDYRAAFSIMGVASVLSAVPTLFIHIQGHRGLLWGLDAPEVVCRRMSHLDHLGSVPNLVLVPDSTGSTRESQLRDPVLHDKSENGSASRRSRLRQASVEIERSDTRSVNEQLRSSW